MKLFIGFGYNDADESFKNMKNIFIETGTELVASSALSKKEGKAAVLPNVWGKFPEEACSDLLALSLTNQLNKVVGRQNLEKSVLLGKDYFKNAIIEKYGENSYIYLSEQINDIANEEREYLDKYFILDEDTQELFYKKILERVVKIQDYILKMEFDKKFEQVNSKEEGIEFLEALLEFSSNRLKIAVIKKDENSNEKNEFEDNSLKQYFEECKSTIELKYGETNIDYKEIDFMGLPINKLGEKISQEEKLEIEQMAMKFEVLSRKRLKHKNKGKIGLFLEKIFGREAGETKFLLPKIDFEDDFTVKSKIENGDFVKKHNKNKEYLERN